MLMSYYLPTHFSLATIIGILVAFNGLLCLNMRIMLEMNIRKQWVLFITSAD